MIYSKAGVQNQPIANLVYGLASIGLILGIFFAVSIAQAAVLGVTQITAVQTFATADGTFDNGWKWVFDATVPTDETIVQMKFANWTNGSNTILAANNIRYYSAQSTNSADSDHAVMITTPATYAGSMKINSGADLDVSKAGRQIQITVEASIPVGSVGGSYSTSYGIKSNLDPDVPIITVDVYNTNPTNYDVTVTASTSTGTLNETSHTFTQNGSFNFIATGPTGITTTKTVMISNIDKTPPVIASHADITSYAGSSGNAIVNYTPSATTDNHDSPGLANCSPEPGSVFAVGSHIITCIATDSAGNNAVPTSFNLIVDPSTSLQVSIANSPSSQTVTKGSTVSSLGIKFVAGATSDVKITQIKLRGLINLDGSDNYSATSIDSGSVIRTVQDVIQSATIWDGSTQLGMARSPDLNGDMNFTNLAWIVPAGTAKIITVKALLSSNLSFGNYTNRFVIDMIGDGTAAATTSNITAQDKDSNVIFATGSWSETDYHLQQGSDVSSNIVLSSNASTVATTVVGSGTMQVSLDGDTPVTAIVTANTSDNSATRVKFASANEAFNVTRLTVANIGSNNSSRSITSVRLFDKNGTLFCSGALDSNGRLRCANDAGLFTVANNNLVTIKVNIDQEGLGATDANSGDILRMALYADKGDAIVDDFKAVGVSSGTALTDTSIGGDSLAMDATSTDGDRTFIGGNDLVVRKTQPTVATIASSTTLLNGQNTIYKFSVTASSNADISLRQFSVATSSSGLTGLNNVRVYENGTMLDASLYSATAVAGDVKGSTDIAVNGSDTLVIGFTTERVVASGTTKTYEVKATVAGAGAGDSVSTYLLSDIVGDQHTTGTVADVKTNATSNFIWSDNSADVHNSISTDASTSSDWTNGYLIKFLPTNPQTISL